MSKALLFWCIRLCSSFRAANRGMQGFFSVKVKEKEIQITFFFSLDDNKTACAQGYNHSCRHSLQGSSQFHLPAHFWFSIPLCAVFRAVSIVPAIAEFVADEEHHQDQERCAVNQCHLPQNRSLVIRHINLYKSPEAPFLVRGQQINFFSD